jgi:hypothetical protein
MSLAKALKSGNQKAAKDIIESADFDPNQIDSKTGETAIHILAREDESELLRDVIVKYESSPDRIIDLEKKDFEARVAWHDSRQL